MTHTSTGIAGLDSILQGGIPTGSAVVLEGAPGTGKTTLGVQFLYAGATAHNEPGIYVTFEELPDQIYAEMKNGYGWDLRALEKENKLRVVCLSPETFLHQLTEPNGIIEQMIRQIGSKRMVIDSISLFKLSDASEKDQRKSVYLVRNVLRKFAQTSLLLQERNGEQSGEIPFENYVADGVIRLAMKEHLQKYRKRTIEVLKMRGTRIVEGEHQYKFVDHGIHVVPALSMVEDKLLPTQFTPTGIARLDKILQGGVPEGSTFLLDTNSKANHKYFIASIFAEQIKAGKNVISLNSSLTSVTDTVNFLSLFDVSIDELLKNNKFFVIEHYKRSYPSQYKDAVLDVSDLNNDEYKQYLRQNLLPVITESMGKGERWYAYYDLNTIFSQRGAQFVTRFFAEEVARAKALGITVLALCNFAEMEPEVSSYLERSSSGVIRTWVDGNYQFMQVTKSPNGVVSEPLIVESSERLPYVNLV
ncbi:ATPase domain-containing protein [Paenibacillus sp.]|uniref:ATPase domain-containing protein n=1 Tax=Paenibacillus sp. TaxID=58172 RepID=UPI002D33540C|nr:ATPase domain-containing protein [Paenibacillus sp.]HZG88345.1 ATPase domain-containing protein [Paenibacillus sp.]